MALLASIKKFVKVSEKAKSLQYNSIHGMELYTKGESICWRGVAAFS